PFRVCRASQQRSEIMQTRTHIVNRFFTSTNLSHIVQTPAIAGAPAFRTPFNPASHEGSPKRERRRF
ncbi:hypothetical protein, partial [Paraburkholderia solisilvae]|uniref:hypothetical protein n=1 Tax=Paraburkholderia solisilvae TaxID=624376 RepID=UPI001C2EB4F8